jgi:hypothetical protein
VPLHTCKSNFNVTKFYSQFMLQYYVTLTAEFHTSSRLWLFIKSDIPAAFVHEAKILNEIILDSELDIALELYLAAWCFFLWSLGDRPKWELCAGLQFTAARGMRWPSIGIVTSGEAGCTYAWCISQSECYGSESFVNWQASQFVLSM